ncbi:MAG: DUF1080 domain-containing protein [Planctomycetia bacterium]|nr:DUF1080 domain-containing protein [Planctomycetia bacterium]
MRAAATWLTVGATMTALTLFLAPSGAAADADKGVEKGFVSMFNGRDLTGWDGKPGWWRVEDGTITSQSTPEKPCTECNYLIWKDGQPGDFELRLKYRLVGGNSGIQLRSLAIPNWDTRGYQADIDATGQWTGALFEHARAGIAMRGQKVVIDEDGTKHVTALGNPDELAKHIKADDWNDYGVVARGNRITLAINGVTMSDTTDNDKAHAARRGIIALQMHPGPPMKIQFKDLRIKIDKESKP